MVTTDDEAPQIICLNYCMIDLDTGYCQTCGRPPIPVTPLEPEQLKFGISLDAIKIVPNPYVGRSSQGSDD